MPMVTIVLAVVGLLCLVLALGFVLLSKGEDTTRAVAFGIIAIACYAVALLWRMWGT